VVGDRGLDKGVIEYTERKSSDSKDLPLEGLVENLHRQIRIELNI